MMQSRRAYAALLAALGVKQLRLCEHVAFGDAHGVWSVLLATYERQSVATRVQLIERLLSMRLSRSESVSLYVARVTDVVRRLAEQEESIGAATQLYVLLRGAQDSFPTVVTLLRMRDALTFDEAVDALKNEEERRQVATGASARGVLTVGQEESEEQAHYVRGGGKKKSKDGRRCYSCGKTGHMKQACPAVECRRCLRRGHMARRRTAARCTRRAGAVATIPPTRRRRARIRRRRMRRSATRRTTTMAGWHEQQERRAMWRQGTTNEEESSTKRSSSRASTQRGGVLRYERCSPV
jgi:hypothetical protein